MKAAETKSGRLRRRRFIADEDVDARLVKALFERGLDIKYEPKGVKNSELYSLACEEHRILISRDKDFLNTLLFPLNPAIIVLRIHPPILSMVTSLLLQFIESEEIEGKTWVLNEEGARAAD